MSESADGASPAATLEVDPEIAAVLERELRRPRDVTTILEERDRFTVYRLVETTADTWKVQAAVFPKRDFEIWFAQQKRLKQYLIQ